jgi:hypothetical protein
MKIIKEENLSNFEFWSGAKDTAKYLTEEEFNTIESVLEDMNPEGMTQTAVNDLFWFEEDTIADWIGYSSFDKIMAEREENE